MSVQGEDQAKSVTTGVKARTLGSMKNNGAPKRPPVGVTRDTSAGGPYYEESQMAEQFRTWLVCQFCGRTTATNDSEHWLNQPHRERLDVRIVRCPEHWSEWALRHTREGRTNDNRKAMAEALAQPVPPIPPHASPFPTTERDDPATYAVRV